VVFTKKFDNVLLIHDDRNLVAITFSSEPSKENEVEPTSVVTFSAFGPDRRNIVRLLATNQRKLREFAQNSGLEADQQYLIPNDIDHQQIVPIMLESGERLNQIRVAPLTDIEPEILHQLEQQDLNSEVEAYGQFLNLKQIDNNFVNNHAG